jgi:hypothetical protein
MVACYSGAGSQVRVKADHAVQDACSCGSMLYLLTEAGKLQCSRAGGPLQTILQGLGRMEALVGACEQGVLLQRYLSGQRKGDPSGYHLVMLPPPRD